MLSDLPSIVAAACYPIHEFSRDNANRISGIKRLHWCKQNVYMRKHLIFNVDKF